MSTSPSLSVTSVRETIVVTNDESVTTVITPSSATLVTISDTGIQGPPGPQGQQGQQGPQGPQGPQGAAGIDLDSTAKINGSLVYYDQASSKFKADTTWTTSTIVDGANF